MAYKPEDGFPYYFDLVKGQKLLPLFSSMSGVEFFRSIDDDKAGYRYAPGKWSIKQILGHITDHERIKMFRAFQASRKEDVQLWGYDQEFLVNNSRFEDLQMDLLLEDFLNVRKASISFIKTLSGNQLKIRRLARDYEVTLEDFLKSVIGHEVHHINIVKSKYLVGVGK